MAREEQEERTLPYMRIWKIGAPIRRGRTVWWPVFERFYGDRPDFPPIAYCKGVGRHQRADNAHALIRELHEYVLGPNDYEPHHALAHSVC
jgi:hypothetical protein